MKPYVLFREQHPGVVLTEGDSSVARPFAHRQGGDTTAGYFDRIAPMPRTTTKAMTAMAPRPMTTFSHIGFHAA